MRNNNELVLVSDTMCTYICCEWFSSSKTIMSKVHVIKCAGIGWSLASGQMVNIIWTRVFIADNHMFTERETQHHILVHTTIVINFFHFISSAFQICRISRPVPCRISFVSFLIKAMLLLDLFKKFQSNACLFS